MENSKKLAILILAAGSSSRLGEPKQLLKYKGDTLLEISVKKALKLSKDVFVVLGNEKEKCEQKLINYNINTLYNKEYKNGIGSSISFGIKHLIEYENTMIMLCDQPFIPVEHLNSLINHIDKDTIVSTLYENNDTPTVPTIFPKKYYKKLMELKEDKGAKSILKKENSIKITLKSKYTIDIDTPKDKDILK